MKVRKRFSLKAEVFLAAAGLVQSNECWQWQGLAWGSSCTQICLHTDFPQDSHPHFFNPEGHFALFKSLLQQEALATAAWHFVHHLCSLFW